MTDRNSPILDRIARVAAVAFALCVLAWLVVRAQRNANGGAAAPAPASEGAPLGEGATAGEELLRDPVVGPVEPIMVPPAVDPTFLFSSKSAAPVVSPPPATYPASVPTYLFSSKTITPLVMPAPPVFLPSSKSGRPLPQQPVPQPAQSPRPRQ
jgi:hypothetical protein